MLATVLTSVALLRAGARVFFGWGPPAAARTDPRDPPIEPSELVGSRGRVPGVMFASAAALIIGGLLVGSRPGAIEAAQRAATTFTDRAAYAATVLGRPAPPPEPVEYVHIGALAVALAIVTVLATIALCGVLLERPRLPFAIPAAIQRPTGGELRTPPPTALRPDRRLRRVGDRRLRPARRVDRRRDLKDLHEV